jgi:hypothetical protein
VRDHHVLERPGAFVEARATLQRQLLGNVDLHVVDEVAVPDRLEQAVREPERQDVERRLLAQEVVDAEDLLLVEDLVDRRVQGLRTGEIGAERLLHDDSGTLDEVCRIQGLHDVECRLGRDAEVVQSAWVATQLILQRRRLRGQGIGTVLDVDVVQLGRELGPLLRADGPGAELAAGLLGELAERGVVVLVEGDADEP